MDRHTQIPTPLGGTYYIYIIKFYHLHRLKYMQHLDELCVQNMYITLKFIYNFNIIINLHFCNDPVLLLLSSASAYASSASDISKMYIQESYVYKKSLHYQLVV